ncbi:DUF4258 domain-containing protein [Ramlibacter sp. G-1-2-2]|uniref:DUF4258 domain-containing protein n=1 Tax=Ramlibacter agri TaxID=2728837 RepID=A0A848HC44_9BURK|nr:DUF4258 domain-containing protein [Ramlibacter agri]NML48027.1 DUF4258 domain-containing protein [Ramlibacter agri]
MFYSEDLTWDTSIPDLTKHASIRMQQRGIRREDVDAALAYGRRIHAKGLTFFVIGEKEVRRYLDKGIDLAQMVGVQVLVSREGAVVTTYRSRDLHAIRVTPRAHRRARTKRPH